MLERERGARRAGSAEDREKSGTERAAKRILVYNDFHLDAVAMASLDGQ
jgi:hypothetical protein